MGVAGWVNSLLSFTCSLGIFAERDTYDCRLQHSVLGWSNLFSACFHEVPAFQPLLGNRVQRHHLHAQLSLLLAHATTPGELDDAGMKKAGRVLNETVTLPMAE